MKGWHSWPLSCSPQPQISDRRTHALGLDTCSPSGWLLLKAFWECPTSRTTGDRPKQTGGIMSLSWIGTAWGQTERSRKRRAERARSGDLEKAQTARKMEAMTHTIKCRPSVIIPNGASHLWFTDWFKSKEEKPSGCWKRSERGGYNSEFQRKVVANTVPAQLNLSLIQSIVYRFRICKLTLKCCFVLFCFLSSKGSAGNKVHQSVMRRVISLVQFSILHRLLFH